jgi:3-hydroxyacyl-CoA dehydrogenase
VLQLWRGENAGVVIEAIYENLAAKQELFGELDALVGKDTLFHTNTSTLSVTATRPALLIGAINAGVKATDPR